MMKPWQNPLNKAPTQPEGKRRKRERENNSEPKEQHGEYKCHAYFHNMLN
jgi:hypothetical protein